MLGITVTRTANAGVLLEMDGMRILLDGVCDPYPPYLGTPPTLRDTLINDMPDVLAFTHKHPDHYDSAYETLYKEKTLRLVFGPESLPFYELLGGIKLSVFGTRHIGKSDIPHASFVIEGSRTVWFMGDAAPISLKRMTDFKKPDLLIIPFAYAITPSAWRMTCELGAEKIILLHMPPKDNDTEGLWSMVNATVGADERLFTLDIAETARV